VRKILPFLTIFFLFSATPAHAFNLFEFLFPPLQMQPSTRSAPGPALAPEVVSNNTYSNTLKDNPITCDGTTSISKTWQPVQQDTGTTDSNGSQISEYVPYDANDLTGEMDVKNLSNNYYRDFQSFFARGSIKCTESKAKANFYSFDLDGSSASLRATPTREIIYYRSQLLVDVAKSLDEINPIDTVIQDYQIAWSCGGNCQELADKSDTSSCRPVYLSELLFGLKNQKIYYSSPDSVPTNFPSGAISAVGSYYSSSCSSSTSCYSLRSKGKTFSPLSPTVYLLMYNQINFVPKGNANSKVTVINYNGYDQSNDKPISPVPTTFDRTLPNAAAATAKTGNLDFMIYSGQSNLSNASLCDSVTTNSEIARDQTVAATIALFVNGTIKSNVPAGQTYDKSVSINVSSTNDAQVVANTQTNEKAYANLIPFETGKNNRQQAFSSTTTTNKNNPIPDPGNRADLLYLQMQSYLRPSSWF
jgi:hypothetical protein